MESVDETDERILAELADNARATFAEIGERVGLSAPAVKRRVDRLLATGVIRGFTTVVDRNVIGWGTRHTFRCTATAPSRRRSCAGPGRGHPRGGLGGHGDRDVRPRSCHLMTRDMRHLESVLERIRGSAAIERSESIVVLSNIVERRVGGRGQA